MRGCSEPTGSTWIRDAMPSTSSVTAGCSASERLLVLFFEDLVADPAAVTARAVAFLGLPGHPLRDTRPQNEATSATATRLNSLIARVPGVGLLSPELRTRVRALVGRAGKRGAPPPPVDDAALLHLADYYRPHNRRLAELTGRGLEAWSGQGKEHVVQRVGPRGDAEAPKQIQPAEQHARDRPEGERGQARAGRRRDRCSGRRRRPARPSSVAKTPAAPALQPSSGGRPRRARPPGAPGTAAPRRSPRPARS